MPSKARKKAKEIPTEVSIKEIMNKMPKMATRVARAAKRFAETAKRLNEGMLRMKKLKERMVAETKKLSAPASAKYVS